MIITQKTPHQMNPPIKTKTRVMGRGEIVQRNKEGVPTLMNVH